MFSLYIADIAAEMDGTVPPQPATEDPTQSDGKCQTFLSLHLYG